MQVNNYVSGSYDMPKQNQKKNITTTGSSDWYNTMGKMMESYMEAEIQKKNEDCRKIFNELSQYKPRVTKEGMEVLDKTNQPRMDEKKVPKADTIEEAEDEVASTKDYGQLIREKMEELFTKIKNGETAPSYQIGAQSFTEEEWEKLLDDFDSVEDMIKQLMEEKQKKEMEAAVEELKISEKEAAEEERRKEEV